MCVDEKMKSESNDQVYLDIKKQFCLHVKSQDLDQENKAKMCEQLQNLSPTLTDKKVSNDCKFIVLLYQAEGGEFLEKLKSLIQYGNLSPLEAEVQNHFICMHFLSHLSDEKYIEFVHHWRQEIKR